MQPSTPETKKTIKILILLLTLLLNVLVACVNGTKEGDPGYATWTPSPSMTATCNPNMSLSTPDNWGKERLIVVLFDPRSEQVVGDQFLEMENKEKTQDVKSFIKEIAPRLLKPGDQLSVFQMGYPDYDDAVVVRLYSYVAVPQLYNTPSPREALTPLPPTDIPTPGLKAVATHNYVVEQSTKRAGTETANASIYGCEIIIWNTIVKLTATAWETTATAEIGDLGRTLDDEWNAYYDPDKVDARGKPFSNNPLYYGDLYYGLSFASEVFQGKCKEFKDCILLIVDDLGIPGIYTPTNLSIDLSDVKIYAVIPHCRFIDQPNCTDLRNYWNSEFVKFGTGEVKEYWNGTRIEINLLDAIGR